VSEIRPAVHGHSSKGRIGENPGMILIPGACVRESFAGDPVWGAGTDSSCTDYPRLDPDGKIRLEAGLMA